MALGSLKTFAETYPLELFLGMEGRGGELEFWEKKEEESGAWNFL
jgi:hypothetical protein